MIKGTVAIVGRPNVGKSTLFNALTRTRDALVDNRPGLTRDRLYGKVYFDDMRERGFLLIDTGGFETEDVYYQPFEENIVWQQTEVAIQEADLILMVFDAKAGVHPHDAELVRSLAKKDKKVIFVANKVDINEHTNLVYDFYSLGIDTVIPTSSAHMRGMDELLVAIEAVFNGMEQLKFEKRHQSETGLKIALVGRPNAGKSSILNRLLGEERSLVSDVAGTTRDAVDSTFFYHHRPYTLIDTAGIRRRSRIHDKAESLSVMRSMQAIERSDIVLLVIDATATLTDQDARIADLAASQYKAMAIVVNKWDLVPDKTAQSAKNYTDYLRRRLSLLSWVPVLYVSCLENQRVHKIMQMIEDISFDFERRAETRKVNDVLRAMVNEHTPALIRATSKRVKFYYATQVRTSPPTILVFCNVAQEIQEGYKRYMINKFREGLGFGNVPLRVIYRSKEEANQKRQEEIIQEQKNEQYFSKRGQKPAIDAEDASSDDIDSDLDLDLDSDFTSDHFAIDNDSREDFQSV